MLTTAIRDLVLLGTGAAGALILEHSRGLIAAKLKARALRAENQATGIFTEMQSQVAAAVEKAVGEKTADLGARVGAIEAALAGKTALPAPAL